MPRVGWGECNEAQHRQSFSCIPSGFCIVGLLFVQPNLQLDMTSNTKP